MQPAGHLEEDSHPVLSDIKVPGFVDRHVKGTVPLAVEYSLTLRDSRFAEPINLLYAWGGAIRIHSMLWARMNA
jgi:DNA-binding HxlR family transcriptional regulator